MPWTLISSAPTPGLLLLSAKRLRRLGLISRMVSKSLQNITAGRTSPICLSWVLLTPVAGQPCIIKIFGLGAE